MLWSLFLTVAFAFITVWNIMFYAWIAGFFLNDKMAQVVAVLFWVLSGYIATMGRGYVSRPTPEQTPMIIGIVAGLAFVLAANFRREPKHA